ncbi:hypothetical protein FDECE_15658 [Fusarium decemcellulare]|nr:hypothetical protein FDECE_15658 [Fusarium decemcellulare]
MEEWERLKVIEQLARDAGPWSLHLSYTLQRLRRDLIDGVFPSKSHDYEARKTRLYREIDEDRAAYVLPSDFESTETIITRLEKPLIDKKATRAEFYQSEPEEDDEDGTFEERLEHVRYNFQRFIDKGDPIQVYNEKWKPLFDEHPRRRFIKHVPQVRSPLVSLDKLERNIRNVLQPISGSLRHWDLGLHPVQITRHLFLSLDDNEMAFLPRWALPIVSNRPQGSFLGPENTLWQDADHAATQANLSLQQVVPFPQQRRTPYVSASVGLFDCLSQPHLDRPEYPVPGEPKYPVTGKQMSSGLQDIIEMDSGYIPGPFYVPDESEFDKMFDFEPGGKS